MISADSRVLGRLGVFGAAASALLVYGFAPTPAANAAHEAKDAAATAPRSSIPATVDNFMLVDAQTMEAHELYRMADDKAVVLVSTGVGCPIARAMTPALKALRDKYKAQGVEMYLVDSNLQDSRDAIAAEAKEYGIDIPILMDSNQLVGEALGVTRTAEVFVITPKTWKVAYHGPVNDAADYGIQKAAEKPFADIAIHAVLAGEPAPPATQASKGCLVDFPARDKKAQLTYVKDVAPILQAKCVACHEQGGIGPMAFNNYAMLKGFAPMIREVIRTDRMPPYHADPHVGQFSDSKRLTPDEIKTIVHWVEAGAPRGEGDDPLAATKHVAQEWPLGKPDVVLKIPAYSIPASGVVDYQRPAIANPLTEGKWLRASTVKPGDRQAVHHVLTGWMPAMPESGKSSETRWQGSVGGYAVGAESEIMPANTGSYIPPSGAIGFQMHYTPYGKPTTDNSEIGLYFYDKPPELIMHSVVVIDNSIDIPAGEGNHEETAYVEFPHDALLYGAFPHAHYRAVANDLWLYTPDGKKQLILTLPRYDFNWQREYTFKTPLKIPAGSKLVAHYWYDNSKRNPSNPDPKVEVTWGEQSWQEMFFTSVRYRWLDETAKHRVNYEPEMNANRMMGMLDDNIDGKIEKAELKGRMGEMLGKYFDVLDKNHDGALDNSELAAAQQMMGGFRGRRQDAAPAPGAKPTGGATPTGGK
jgi:mono/diheme cytochrome c family protein